MNIYYEPVNVNQWNMFENVEHVGHIEPFLAVKSMEVGDLVLLHVGAQNKKYPSGIYAYGTIVNGPYILRNKPDDYCNNKNTVDVRIDYINYKGYLISHEDSMKFINQFRTPHKIQENHYDDLLELLHYGMIDVDKSNKLNNVWIFPSNIGNFDADYVFHEDGDINWYQVNNTRNVRIGDIVYMYSSTPVQEIHWKCEVLDVSYYLSDDDLEERSYIQDEYYSDGPFILLKPVFEFEFTHFLSYKKLKEHGLKSRLMGPQHIDKELYEYLIEIENMHKSDQKKEDYLGTLDQEELKKLAVQSSSETAVKKEYTVTNYKRSSYVAYYAKKIANGICQLCEKPAPFKDKNGNPYLETHHIVWLSKGGADSVDNTVALCPNCHKRMHVVNDKKDVEKLLSKSNKL